METMFTKSLLGKRKIVAVCYLLSFLLGRGIVEIKRFTDTLNRSATLGTKTPIKHVLRTFSPEAFLSIALQELRFSTRFLAEIHSTNQLTARWSDLHEPWRHLALRLDPDRPFCTFTVLAGVGASLPLLELVWHGLQVWTYTKPYKTWFDEWGWWYHTSSIQFDVHSDCNKMKVWPARPINNRPLAAAAAGEFTNTWTRTPLLAPAGSGDIS